MKFELYIYIYICYKYIYIHTYIVHSVLVTGEAGLALRSHHWSLEFEGHSAGLGLDPFIGRSRWWRRLRCTGWQPTRGWVVWGFSPNVSGWSIGKWMEMGDVEVRPSDDMAGSSASWGVAPLLNRTSHLIAIDGMTGMANIVIKVFAKKMNCWWQSIIFQRYVTNPCVPKILTPVAVGSSFAPLTFHRSRLVLGNLSRFFFQVKRELLEAEPQSIILSSFLNPKAPAGKLLGVEVLGLDFQAKTLLA